MAPTKQLTVKDIHDDFNGAEERLLKEAKQILNMDLSAAEKKAEMVKNLGFGNSLPGKTFDELRAKKSASAAYIQALTYFKHYYPLQKFITLQEVEALCKKYSLVLGLASRYIGDIPEKNILEIGRFRLRIEDFQRTGSNVIEVDNFEVLSQFLFRQNAGHSRMHDNRAELEMMRMKAQINEALFREKRMIGLRMEGRFDSLSNLPYPTEVSYQQNAVNPSAQNKNKPEFKICAPVKDFDMQGYSVKGHEIVKDAPPLPDPIVLQPVEYNGVKGALIISAWGDEASDEMVVNTINN